VPLVECVPNFSEGRDQRVIDALHDAIANTPGAHVLDVSSDKSHHRTVITFVASPEAAVPAALAAMTVARDRIDLTRHQGQHPRIGATDVVPFIPLDGATMEDCIALARQLGARAAAQLDIPVYLYERAATTPTRENLADVRRGQFEGLRDELATSPARRPDFGPAAVHPTAGATAIGARPFLVAYNIYLGESSHLPAAKAIAKAIRGSSGGLRGVKALGLVVDGQAQVSMNLLDTEQTPLHSVFELVKTEAATFGLTPTWSELVGLVPERVILDAGARHVQLRGFSRAMLLEHRIRELDGGRMQYAAVEPSTTAPALDAGSLRHHLTRLVQRDVHAHERVQAAYTMLTEPDAARTARTTAIHDAMLHAAETALETARAALRVAEMAADLAERGNRHTAADAYGAALIAEATCKGAEFTVRINVALRDHARTTREATLAAEARTCLLEATAYAQIAERAAERAIAQ